MKKEERPYDYLKSSCRNDFGITMRYTFLLLMIIGVTKLHAVDSSFTKTFDTGFQQITVSGTVIDEKGNPLPAVNIQVEGTTSGVMSDVNGKYSINIPNKDAVLIFSFVGYTTQKISVSGKSVIDISMIPALTGLDEVIVVGYGTQKKANLTGSVDVISNTELSKKQAPTVSQLLQGLSPSTNFTITDDKGFQPGATMAMTIRGIGSLNGGSPYILINGVPGDMNNLNPEDIESISVLKDAAASAIYGARAAYGVVLITTKKGGKDEKMSVTYSGAVLLKTPPPLPKALDSYTWTRVMNESGDNAGSGHPFSNLQLDQIIAYQNKDWNYLKQFYAPGQTVPGAAVSGNDWNYDASYANNDFWKIYYGHSINQKHDISLQGGTKKASYYISAGYLSDAGVLNYGTDLFQRLNIMGKIDVNIAPWWDFSWEPRLSNSTRERPHMTNEGDYGFMFREIARTYPFVPLYDGYGVYSWESHIPSILGGGTDSWNQIDAWNTFRTELRPLKGWKINADFAFNNYQGITTKVQKTIYEHKVDNSYIPSGVSIPNNISRTDDDNNYWNANIYSSYNLNINNDHNFAILAGVQMERGMNNQLNGYKTDLIVPDVASFQTATGNAILWEALSHRALEGYFGRFNYNYKEKYMLESNVRYDGSYVFRKGNRWGFFPSFSVGWNVNKEAFWSNIEKYINAFKIRASWGSLGNQNVSPYSDLELLQLQTGKLPWIFDFGGTQPIGYTSAPNLVNKDLTWETATTKNIGTDLSFLNNRLTAGLDLFERLTTNMVGPSQAKPGVLGADVPSENNSTLRTRGWELTLSWKHSLANGFSYYVAFNLSNYKSIVTKYYNPTGTLTTWYEGAEVGEIWGYTVHDLFRTQSELDSYLAKEDLSQLGSNWRTGDVKYEDTNNDGKVNNGTFTKADHGDLSKIGNSQPHGIYGITAGINFKGFDFSMQLRGVAKQDIYFDREATLFWGFHQGWWDAALQPRNLDYFRDTPGTKYSGLYEGDKNINTTAYWPRPYQSWSDEVKNKNNPNTRYLQSAAYLRLQNIQLGYTLPQSVCSKLKIQKLRVALAGDNLFTFTKLPHGIDPVAPVGFYWGNTPGRLTYGADRIYSLSITITY